MVVFLRLCLDQGVFLRYECTAVCESPLLRGDYLDAAQQQSSLLFDAFSCIKEVRALSGGLRWCEET